MNVIGRDGVALEEVWKDRPVAYMAISVPEFPNFLMLNGPNGPVGNISLIDVAEQQFTYIMQRVEEVRSGCCTEISASQAAMDHFDADRTEAAKKTIWHSGCNSWYLDAPGVPAVWPWTVERLKEDMAKPQLDDYETIAH